MLQGIQKRLKLVSAPGDIKGTAPRPRLCSHRVAERDGPYLQKGVAVKKKEIIFFDELGFGWVVDKAMIQMIHDKSENKEVIVEKTLADLLRRP
jgi:hypothetical protein